MIKFLCKTVKGKIEPLQSSKKQTLQKLLDDYERLNMKYIITIENVTKNINESQESLYRAFIYKSADHFGNSFQEMENILKRFHPLNSFYTKDSKPVSRWNSKDLENFINQANALLLDADSDFKF